MTRSGLQADFAADDTGARFTLTNTGIGHAFPTYVTPKVVMHAVLLDEMGNPVTDTAVEREIRRRVESDGAEWRELSDIRLTPGKTATLFLTMPISWRGTLAQYAGRLHRLHPGKREVIIYDYVDEAVPVLARMSGKRIRGYDSLGYTISRQMP
jgi:hypothetical protein